MLNYKKMISRVKKNRPSYNGRFQALPPMSAKRSASQQALGNAEGHPIESAETQLKTDNKRSARNSKSNTPLGESAQQDDAVGRSAEEK